MGLLNQLSLNLASNRQNADSSANTSGIDIDFDFDIGGGSGFPPSCDTPTTFRELLLTLVNEQVQVTTPFGAVTGILLVVEDDYIVIVENAGEQVLVAIDKN